MRNSIWPMRDSWEDPWSHEETPAAVLAFLQAPARAIPPEILALAADPLTTRPAYPPTDEAVMSGIEAAQIASDIAPALGMDAPHWCLGPWMEELNVRNPFARRAILHAVGEMTFALDQVGRPSPHIQWTRTKPIPSVEDRKRARALDRAPQGLYTLERQVDAERWLLSPQLASAWAPEGPVLLEPLGGVLGAVGEGDTLIARIAWDTRGPVALLGFGIPGKPPVHLAKTWEIVAVAAWRSVVPRAPRSECLRRRGFDLVRGVHEWLWLETHR